MPVWLPLRPKSRLITHQSPLQTSNIPERGRGGGDVSVCVCERGYFTCQTRSFYFNEELQTDNRSIDAQQQFPLQVITQSAVTSAE